MLLGGSRRRGEAETQAAEPRAVPGFDAVYTEHAGFVCRVLRGMGLPDAQLDDAVQDVFVVVHRRLGEFDGQAQLRTWLFSIALRVASHYRRRAKRARDHVPVPDLLTSDARSPLEQALDAEALLRVQRALDSLDDDKRALLVLAEIEELSAPQIAALIGAPVNTVYTRLRRARLAFAALWRKWSEP